MPRSNGVLQPFRELGWWRWMYRLSPYTYLIEGLLGQAIGREQISCADVEYVQVNPPSGQSCAQFLGPFISANGGYVTNPDAAAACNYCSYRTTDQFLFESFNIEYAHRWRNFGLMWAFIIFNVRRTSFCRGVWCVDDACRSSPSTRSRTCSASARATHCGR